MELLCPNCQKKLTVPEQYAGQLMRCPLCQGTFTVPTLATAAAAESPEAYSGLTQPPKAETYHVAAEPPAATPASAAAAEVSRTTTAPVEPAAAAPSAPPRTPSAGFTRVHTLSVNPKVVPWLAPAGLVLVFILMFFPWPPFQIVQIKDIVDFSSFQTSVNAWGLGFGKGGSVWFIFYDLLTLIAMLLAVAAVLFTMKVIPEAPALQPILPWRYLIVGCVAGLALMFVTLDYIIALFSRGFILVNFWGILAWWLHLIAVLGAFLEFWLEQRGTAKALPRVTIEW
jgi:hypothetical protein